MLDLLHGQLENKLNDDENSGCGADEPKVVEHVANICPRNGIPVAQISTIKCSVIQCVSIIRCRTGVERLW